MATLFVPLCAPSLQRPEVFLTHAVALGAGLALARFTAADAPVRRPSVANVAGVAALAVVLTAGGVGYLVTEKDVRSEAFRLLSTEERGLDAFERRRPRAGSPGGNAEEALGTVVENVLRACARARQDAQRLDSRFQQELAAYSELDRYGRISNWRGFVGAREQLAMGALYADYLRSRDAVWRSRLRYVAERKLDALEQVNRADAAARAALRKELERPRPLYD
jgi:hypothetical protein